MRHGRAGLTHARGCEVLVRVHACQHPHSVRACSSACLHIVWGVPHVICASCLSTCAGMHAALGPSPLLLQSSGTPCHSLACHTGSQQSQLCRFSIILVRARYQQRTAACNGA